MMLRIHRILAIDTSGCIEWHEGSPENVEYTIWPLKGEDRRPALAFYGRYGGPDEPMPCWYMEWHGVLYSWNETIFDCEEKIMQLAGELGYRMKPCTREGWPGPGFMEGRRNGRMVRG